MGKKTKELLDNLNKIVKKPDRFEPKPSIPDTNRMWKSVHENGISPLPKHYNPIKWRKEVDQDGTIDYWVPFDRVYGDLYHQYLMQKNGTEYKGKLYNKNRLIKGTDGNNFKSKCTVTADGRWFDNVGFPIDPPTKLEPEPVKSKEELEEEKEKKLNQEQNMLKGLN
jgi:hypothetical protein